MQAQPLSVPALMRAGRWAEADQAASAYADPVARKLVLYERLLTPGAATAGEIAAFLRDAGAWPRAALLRRLDAALAAEPDDAAVLPLCTERRPVQLAARLRCASAFLKAGQAGEATLLARETWIEASLDAGQEAQFLRDWAAAITPADQQARFDRLAWTDPGTPGSAASRQAARLPPPAQAVAAARLALLRGDNAAPALLAKVPVAARREPGIVLAELRWTRRTGQAIAAADLWTSAGSAPSARRPKTGAAYSGGSGKPSRASCSTRATRHAPSPSRAAPCRPATPSSSRAGSHCASSGSRTKRRDASPHLPRSRPRRSRRDAQATGSGAPGRPRATRPARRTAYAAAAPWLTTFYGQLAARAGLGQ